MTIRFRESSCARKVDAKKRQKYIAEHLLSINQIYAKRAFFAINKGVE
jgi:hypothetical protein